MPNLHFSPTKGQEQVNAGAQRTDSVSEFDETKTKESQTQHISHVKTRLQKPSSVTTQKEKMEVDESEKHKKTLESISKEKVQGFSTNVTKTETQHETVQCQDKADQLAISSIEDGPPNAKIVSFSSEHDYVLSSQSATPLAPSVDAFVEQETQRKQNAESQQHKTLEAEVSRSYEFEVESDEEPLHTRGLYSIKKEIHSDQQLSPLSVTVKSSNQLKQIEHKPKLPAQEYSQSVHVDLKRQTPSPSTDKMHLKQDAPEILQSELKPDDDHNNFRSFTETTLSHQRREPISYKDSNAAINVDASTMKTDELPKMIDTKIQTEEERSVGTHVSTSIDANTQKKAYAPVPGKTTQTDLVRKDSREVLTQTTVTTSNMGSQTTFNRGAIKKAVEEKLPPTYTLQISDAKMIDFKNKENYQTDERSRFTTSDAQTQELNDISIQTQDVETWNKKQTQATFSQQSVTTQTKSNTMQKSRNVPKDLFVGSNAESEQSGTQTVKPGQNYMSTQTDFEDDCDVNPPKRYKGVEKGLRESKMPSAEQATYTQIKIFQEETTATPSQVVKNFNTKSTAVQEISTQTETDTTVVQSKDDETQTDIKVNVTKLFESAPKAVKTKEVSTQKNKQPVEAIVTGSSKERIFQPTAIVPEEKEVTVIHDIGNEKEFEQKAIEKTLKKRDEKLRRNKREKQITHTLNVGDDRMKYNQPVSPTIHPYIVSAPAIEQSRILDFSTNINEENVTLNTEKRKQTSLDFQEIQKTSTQKLLEQSEDEMTTYHQPNSNIIQNTTKVLCIPQILYDVDETATAEPKFTSTTTVKPIKQKWNPETSEFDENVLELKDEAEQRIASKDTKLVEKTKTIVHKKLTKPFVSDDVKTQVRLVSQEQVDQEPKSVQTTDQESKHGTRFITTIDQQTIPPSELAVAAAETKTFQAQIASVQQNQQEELGKNARTNGTTISEAQPEPMTAESKTTTVTEVKKSKRVWNPKTRKFDEVVMEFKEVSVQPKIQTDNELDSKSALDAADDVQKPSTLEKVDVQRTLNQKQNVVRDKPSFQLSKDLEEIPTTVDVEPQKTTARVKKTKQVWNPKSRKFDEVVVESTEVLEQPTTIVEKKEQPTTDTRTKVPDDEVKKPKVAIKPVDEVKTPTRPASPVDQEQVDRKLEYIETTVQENKHAIRFVPTIDEQTLLPSNLAVAAEEIKKSEVPIAGVEKEQQTQLNKGDRSDSTVISDVEPHVTVESQTTSVTRVQKSKQVWNSKTRKFDEMAIEFPVVSVQPQPLPHIQLPELAKDVADVVQNSRTVDNIDIQRTLISKQNILRDTTSFKLSKDLEEIPATAGVEPQKTTTVNIKKTKQVWNPKSRKFDEVVVESTEVLEQPTIFSKKKQQPTTDTKSEVPEGKERKSKIHLKPIVEVNAPARPASPVDQEQVDEESKSDETTVQKSKHDTRVISMIDEQTPSPSEPVESVTQTKTIEAQISSVRQDQRKDLSKMVKTDSSKFSEAQPEPAVVESQTTIVTDVRKPKRVWNPKTRKFDEVVMEFKEASAQPKPLPDIQLTKHAKDAADDSQKPSTVDIVDVQRTLDQKQNVVKDKPSFKLTKDLEEILTTVDMEPQKTTTVHVKKTKQVWNPKSRKFDEVVVEPTEVLEQPTTILEKKQQPTTDTKSEVPDEVAFKPVVEVKTPARPASPVDQEQVDEESKSDETTVQDSKHDTRFVSTIDEQTPSPSELAVAAKEINSFEAQIANVQQDQQVDLSKMVKTDTFKVSEAQPQPVTVESKTTTVTEVKKSKRVWNPKTRKFDEVVMEFKEASAQPKPLPDIQLPEHTKDVADDAQKPSTVDKVDVQRTLDQKQNVVKDKPSFNLSKDLEDISATVDVESQKTTTVRVKKTKQVWNPKSRKFDEVVVESTEVQKQPKTISEEKQQRPTDIKSKVPDDEVKKPKVAFKPVDETKTPTRPASLVDPQPVDEESKSDETTVQKSKHDTRVISMIDEQTPSPSEPVESVTQTKTIEAQISSVRQDQRKDLSKMVKTDSSKFSEAQPEPAVVESQTTTVTDVRKPKRVWNPKTRKFDEVVMEFKEASAQPKPLPDIQLPKHTKDVADDAQKPSTVDKVDVQRTLDQKQSVAKDKPSFNLSKDLEEIPTTVDIEPQKTTTIRVKKTKQVWNPKSRKFDEVVVESTEVQKQPKTISEEKQQRPTDIKSKVPDDEVKKPKVAFKPVDETKTPTRPASPVDQEQVDEESKSDETTVQKSKHDTRVISMIDEQTPSPSEPVESVTQTKTIEAQISSVRQDQRKDLSKMVKTDSSKFSEAQPEPAVVESQTTTVTDVRKPKRVWNPKTRKFDEVVMEFKEASAQPNPLPDIQLPEHAKDVADDRQKPSTLEQVYAQQTLDQKQNIVKDKLSIKLTKDLEDIPKTMDVEPQKTTTVRVKKTKQVWNPKSRKFDEVVVESTEVLEQPTTILEKKQQPTTDTKSEVPDDEVAFKPVVEAETPARPASPVDQEPVDEESKSDETTVQKSKHDTRFVSTIDEQTPSPSELAVAAKEINSFEAQIAGVEQDQQVDLSKMVKTDTFKVSEAQPQPVTVESKTTTVTEVKKSKRVWNPKTRKFDELQELSTVETVDCQNCQKAIDQKQSVVKDKPSFQLSKDLEEIPAIVNVEPQKTTTIYVKKTKQVWNPKSRKFDEVAVESTEVLEQPKTISEKKHEPPADIKSKVFSNTMKEPKVDLKPIFEVKAPARPTSSVGREQVDQEPKFVETTVQENEHSTEYATTIDEQTASPSKFTVTPTETKTFRAKIASAQQDQQKELRKNVRTDSTLVNEAQPVTAVVQSQTTIVTEVKKTKRTCNPRTRKFDEEGIEFKEVSVQPKPLPNIQLPEPAGDVVDDVEKLSTVEKVDVQRTLDEKQNVAKDKPSFKLSKDLEEIPTTVDVEPQKITTVHVKKTKQVWNPKSRKFDEVVVESTEVLEPPTIIAEKTQQPTTDAKSKVSHGKVNEPKVALKSVDEVKTPTRPASPVGQEQVDGERKSVEAAAQEAEYATRFIPTIDEQTASLSELALEAKEIIKVEVQTANVQHDQQENLSTVNVRDDGTSISEAQSVPVTGESKAVTVTEVKKTKRVWNPKTRKFDEVVMEFKEVSVPPKPLRDNMVKAESARDIADGVQKPSTVEKVDVKRTLDQKLAKDESQMESLMLEDSAAVDVEPQKTTTVRVKKTKQVWNPKSRKFDEVVVEATEALEQPTTISKKKQQPPTDIKSKLPGHKVKERKVAVKPVDEAKTSTRPASIVGQEQVDGKPEAIETTAQENKYDTRFVSTIDQQTSLASNRAVAAEDTKKSEVQIANVQPDRQKENRKDFRTDSTVINDVQLKPVTVEPQTTTVPEVQNSRRVWNPKTRKFDEVKMEFKEVSVQPKALPHIQQPEHTKDAIDDLQERSTVEIVDVQQTLDQKQNVVKNKTSFELSKDLEEIPETGDVEPRKTTTVHVKKTKQVWNPKSRKFDEAVVELTEVLEPPTTIFEKKQQPTTDTKSKAFGDEAKDPKVASVPVGEMKTPARPASPVGQEPAGEEPKSDETTLQESNQSTRFILTISEQAPSPSENVETATEIEAQDASVQQNQQKEVNKVVRIDGTTISEDQPEPVVVEFQTTTVTEVQKTKRVWNPKTRKFDKVVVKSTKISEQPKDRNDTRRPKLVLKVADKVTTPIRPSSPVIHAEVVGTPTAEKTHFFTTAVRKSKRADQAVDAVDQETSSVTAATESEETKTFEVQPTDANVIQEVPNQQQDGKRGVTTEISVKKKKPSTIEFTPKASIFDAVTKPVTKVKMSEQVLNPKTQSFDEIVIESEQVIDQPKLGQDLKTKPTTKADSTAVADAQQKSKCSIKLDDAKPADRTTSTAAREHAKFASIVSETNVFDKDVEQNNAKSSDLIQTPIIEEIEFFTDYPNEEASTENAQNLGEISDSDRIFSTVTSSQVGTSVSFTQGKDKVAAESLLSHELPDREQLPSDKSLARKTSKSEQVKMVWNPRTRMFDKTVVMKKVITESSQADMSRDLDRDVAQTVAAAPLGEEKKPKESETQLRGEKRYNVGETTHILIKEASFSEDVEQPVFLKSLLSIETAIGEPAVFNCRVEGKPSPIIKWFVDDELIEPPCEGFILVEDDSTNTSSLIWSNPSMGDNQKAVRCEISNTAGSAESTAFLTLKGNCVISTHKSFINMSEHVLFHHFII